MDEDLIVARAKRARILLGSEDVQQAFADVGRALFADWQAETNPVIREAMHAEHRGVRRVLGQLKAWADELALRNIE